MQGLVPMLIPLVVSILVASPAGAQNPFAQTDESWITIDGHVVDVMRNQFTLDYGDGIITVEFDDGDRDADAYVLRADDAVTVSGRIDDDFLELATIEAGSVYVKNLDTYFYSSAIDEEDRLSATVEPMGIPRTTLRGIVTAVYDDDFSINTGLREITVRVDEMPYDPLDDLGYQKIEIGDYVSVTADPDWGLFEGRVLDAVSVVTIHDR